MYVQFLVVSTLPLPIVQYSCAVQYEYVRVTPLRTINVNLY